jgi:DNA-binding transcriptional regulator YhcF (GntR family)
MQGQINTSFATYQADLFESGLVAKIGANSFALWSAIKAHSDYSTGESWPSVRRLMELTGLASATVQKSLKTLEENRLLRSEIRGKRRVYVARERLDIQLGSRILCTVVIDYVPAKIRQTIAKIKSSLQTGENDPEAFSAVEIIPGPGFAWDERRGVLAASIPARDLPPLPSSPEPAGELVERVKAIAERARSRKALPTK